MAAENTSDLIKEVHEQMQSYARDNFGARNGPDFADLARDLMETDAFTMKAFFTLTLQMITADSVLKKLPTDPGNKGDVTAVRNAVRGSTTEHMLLDVFYWGYSFGKRTAEIDALKNMAEKS